MTEGDGPLLTPSQHGWAISAQTGKPFTDGLETIRFTGADNLTIHAIDLVGDSELEVVGALIAENDLGRGTVQYLPHFPPRQRANFGSLQPAIGATLSVRDPALPGRELLLGVSASQPGIFERTGIRIEYSVGQERYVETLRAELIVCASSEPVAPGTECERAGLDQ